MNIEHLKNAVTEAEKDLADKRNMLALVEQLETARANLAAVTEQVDDAKVELATLQKQIATVKDTDTAKQAAAVELAVVLHAMATATDPMGQNRIGMAYLRACGWRASPNGFFKRGTRDVPQAMALKETIADVLAPFRENTLASVQQRADAVVDRLSVPLAVRR